MLFQGKWVKQFNPTDTIMKYFFWQGRADKIPFMHNIGWFLFADSPRLSAKVLKIILFYFFLFDMSPKTGTLLGIQACTVWY